MLELNSYLPLEHRATNFDNIKRNQTLINHDLDHKKFFIQDDHQSLEIIFNPKIDQYAIDQKIYFKPSHCPIVTIHDYLEGTCFQGLYVPTGSYKFDVQSKDIVVSVLEKKLPLDVYVSTLDKKITKKIEEIYHHHSIVNLCYSGGIDSMVLLSYIIELDLLPRTRIVIFENHTQSHSSCLHKNAIQKSHVMDLLDSISDRCLEIRWHAITIEDLADAFNNGDLADIKCFATYSLLKHYRDQVFIIGHHGNQIFLHKNIFFDEILIQQPQWRYNLEQYISSKSNYYTASAANYRVPENLIGIERRHLLAKPWEKYNGFNGNQTYAPIADDDDFLMLRSLDFSKIHPDVILEAQVAVKLIRKNIKGDISAYIGIESIKDNDNLEDAQIPQELISSGSLWIPDNLKHDAEGLEYIKNEIQQIQSKKSLAINSAVSIKSLQHIATTYK